ADVHHDPDRLRRPVRRNAAGHFEEISWDEAFDLVARRIREIRERHGGDAIGFYWGNPTGNNHGALLMLSSFTKALGTRNRFSSGSQDANPRIVTSYELYGSSISIPIPDIDRTDYFLCLGGNPMISNGSVMTAPDMRRRLRAGRDHRPPGTRVRRGTLGGVLLTRRRMRRRPRHGCDVCHRPAEHRHGTARSRGRTDVHDAGLRHRPRRAHGRPGRRRPVA